MNWTGGNLTRHSKGANKGFAQRQKAHFAKVRSKLQDGLAGTGNESGRSAAPHYLADQPDVERRISDAPSHLETKHTSRPDFYNQSSSEHRAKRSQGNPRQRVATPPSLEDIDRDILPHREHHDGVLPVDAYKRLLLKDEDWLGLVPARPLSLNFTESKDKVKVGKRRKLNFRPKLQSLAESHHMAIEEVPVDRNNMLSTGDTILVRTGPEALNDEIGSEIASSLDRRARNVVEKMASRSHRMLNNPAASDKTCVSGSQASVDRVRYETRHPHLSPQPRIDWPGSSPPTRSGDRQARNAIQTHYVRQPDNMGVSGVPTIFALETFHSSSHRHTTQHVPQISQSPLAVGTSLSDASPVSSWSPSLGAGRWQQVSGREANARSERSRLCADEETSFDDKTITLSSPYMADGGHSLEGSIPGPIASLGTSDSVATAGTEDASTERGDKTPMRETESDKHGGELSDNSPELWARFVFGSIGMQSVH